METDSMICELFNCDERHLLKSCLTDRIDDIQEKQKKVPFGSSAYNTYTRKINEVVLLLDKIPLFKKD